LACPLCNSKNTVESALEGVCLRRACGHNWRKGTEPHWVEALESPVRRQMDVGEFEHDQERKLRKRPTTAQAPDEEMPGGLSSGNPNGVMRGDGRPRAEENDLWPDAEERPRWQP